MKSHFRDIGTKYFSPQFSSADAVPKKFEQRRSGTSQHILTHQWIWPMSNDIGNQDRRCDWHFQKYCTNFQSKVCSKKLFWDYCLPHIRKNDNHVFSGYAISQFSVQKTTVRNAKKEQVPAKRRPVLNVHDRLSDDVNISSLEEENNYA